MSEQRQIDLEVLSVQRGLARYTADLAAKRASDKEYDGSPANKFVVEVMEKFIPEVARFRTAAGRKLVRGMTTGVRLGGWEALAYALPAPVLAYIAVRTVMGAAHGTTRSVHKLGGRIGLMANLQMNWDDAQRQERERVSGTEERNRINLMKSKVRQINPRHVQKWLRWLDGIQTQKWSLEHRMKLGSNLALLLCEVCPEFFELRTVHENVRGRIRVVRTIFSTPLADARLESAHDWCAMERPWLLPMVCQPLPWKWDHDAGRYTGGYLRTPRKLVREGKWSHTAVLTCNDVVPPTVLDALNTVQDVRWRINTDVLAVALEARRQRIISVLPVEPQRDLPPLVDGEAWAAMSGEEKGKVKRERRIVHNHNNRLEAKRQALRRKLNTAEEFADEDVIYFPHFLDFRGRAYPCPQDLNPQADDIARALLTFADAKVLGKLGFRYLIYHVANCYGVDKGSREDQLMWVARSIEGVQAVARDPLGAGLEFMSKADEPWQFFAACVEYMSATLHLGGPLEYPSSLPVYVDGSCNGLQHLSAMARDPVGAKATNLARDPVRHDIYQIVADKVIHQVIVDDMTARSEGLHEHPAYRWCGEVTRKTVKRGVMTTPYGVTSIGMRDQLIKDGFVTPDMGDIMANAAYMRDRMKEAIDGTVVAARDVMQWMRDNAEILALNGKPVTWTTPIGFTVRQSYVELTLKRIKTVLGGEMHFWYDPGTGPLLKRKQKDSIAPNIIHSFDAAHMMLSILGAADHGITHFSVIHDSFGTHAADMPLLLRAIREEFCDIYSLDWMARLQKDFRASVGPGVPLVDPPDMGDFEVEETLGAEYFFA